MLNAFFLYDYSIVLRGEDVYYRQRLLNTHQNKSYNWRCFIFDGTPCARGANNSRTG